MDPLSFQTPGSLTWCKSISGLKVSRKGTERLVMSTFKTTIAGIEVQADSATDLARQIKDLKALLDEGTLTPLSKEKEEDGPSWYEGALDAVCDAADCVYTTSTKDMVDGVCSMWSGMCDAITGDTDSK